MNDNTSSGVPSGVITMWSGTTSDVPSGWTLCDGNNENGMNVPDLRNRFIVGAGDQYTADDTGGDKKVTLSQSEMPSHNHSGSTDTDGKHSHDVYNSGENLYGTATVGDTTSFSENLSASIPTTSAGSHDHSLSINNTGDDKSHENRPPYYALAFIMKV